MDAKEACTLINQTIFMPGWDICAEVSDRYDSAAVVHIQYPTHNFNREEAPSYSTEIKPSAHMWLHTGALESETEV